MAGWIKPGTLVKRPSRTENVNASETPDLRVILVAVNANSQTGGEARLPLKYFQLLCARGIDVHLICHERNREDLHQQAPAELDRIHLTANRASIRFLERMGRRLPRTVKSMTLWVAMGAVTSIDLRRVARALARESPCPVIVHEPVPVSPRQPSFMNNLGASVVIGPLNGGMTYPPGFIHDVSPAERVVRWISRAVSDLANMVVRGKRDARLILVANPRTRRALPYGAASGRVRTMTENGVDLELFPYRIRERPSGPPRFAFVGQLVDWKRVDLLVDALSRVPEHYLLDIVGFGPMEQNLRQRVVANRLDNRVEFHGKLTHEQIVDVLNGCDAMVLPSVYECGGAVVLEAMAVGLPVIAVQWGGPADYVVADETGILVEPRSPEFVSAGLANAMMRLGSDRALARRMGESGRARVEALYDWEGKVDEMVVLYREAAAGAVS